MTGGTNGLARRLIGALGAVLLTAGCGYGPVEYSVEWPVIGTDSTASFAVIALPFEEIRKPTGLYAFPDGGKAKIGRQGVSTYLCDEARKQAHFVRIIDNV